jgi:hypothetical protein
MNVAQDPGTYLYNAPPPWDNRLAGSAVHNTLIVDGQDQMLRAGRFLYLERAQAQVTAGVPAAGVPAQGGQPGVWSQLVARHDGYRRLDLVHQRTVTASPAGGWLVEDTLLPAREKLSAIQPHTTSLHWLLPDWPWQVLTGENEMQFVLCLESLQGPLQLHLSVRGETDESPVPAQLQLVRAGKLLHGCGPVNPIWGWVSPTYGDKMPALSVRLLVRRLPPIYLTSVWFFE